MVAQHTAQGVTTRAHLGQCHQPGLLDEVGRSVNYILATVKLRSIVREWSVPDAMRGRLRPELAHSRSLAL